MHAKVSSFPLTEEDGHESTRPIRALHRGLEVLAELNRLDRAAINTLAGAVRLPRTTTYRILETLRLAGYVVRDPHDDCYRPTIMVRALSDGFDDQAMVAHIAKPHLAALGAQIVWPVAIATPSGGTMMIRETTDRDSPLALEQYSAGVRVPMLSSAAGRAYLAFCAGAERDALLESLSRSSLPEDRLARSRIEVERLLNETRTQGFGMAQRARRVSEETSLAIPVRAKDRILATVTVRYAATAVPLRTAVEQFLPPLVVGGLLTVVIVQRASELAEAIKRASEVADIVELRLDCFEDDEREAMFPLLRDHLNRDGTPMLITFRPAEQGGHTATDSGARRSFWVSLKRISRGALMDLELDLALSIAADGLARESSIDWGRVICSHHDFSGVPSDLEQIYGHMAATIYAVLPASIAR